MWVRIEDTLYTHLKARKAGKAALGLHVMALSMTCHQMLDGLVPREFLNGALKLAEKLILAGLWERDGENYRIHDYLKYNPSRAETMARREADRSRKIPSGIQKDSLVLSSEVLELELSSQQRKENLERLATMTRSLTEKLQ